MAGSISYAIGFGYESTSYKSLFNSTLPKEYDGLFKEYAKQFGRCMLTRMTFKASKFHVHKYTFIAEKECTDADRESVVKLFGKYGNLATTVLAIDPTTQGLPATILYNKEDASDLPVEFTTASIEPRDIDVATLFPKSNDSAIRKRVKCLNCRSKYFYRLLPKSRKYIACSKAMQAENFVELFKEMECNKSLRMHYMRPFIDNWLHKNDRIRMTVITINFEFDVSHYWTFIDNNTYFFKPERPPEKKEVTS